jgi:hypothetical protein
VRDKEEKLDSTGQVQQLGLLDIVGYMPFFFSFFFVLFFFETISNIHAY